MLGKQQNEVRDISSDTGACVLEELQSITRRLETHEQDDVAC